MLEFVMRIRTDKCERDDNQLSKMHAIYKH